MELTNLNLNDMRKAASELAKDLSQGDVVCLYGTLGAGKTTFTQFLVEALGGQINEVTSPTFNILHIYDTSSCEVHHFDLYRLDDPKEVYELGIEDSFLNGITIIEWPEIIEGILPKHTIKVVLSISETNPNQRDINTTTDLS